MFKKVSIALALIMMFSMIPVVQNAKADDSKYQTVRVKLSIGDNPTSYSFFLDGNYSIEGSDILLERQLYTIKASNGTLNLYYGNEKRYSATSIKFLRHNPQKNTYNDFIWMPREGTNYRYLGDMKFILDSGKYIMAVNYVYMEDYLYGVVGNEMGNTDYWPKEALKAQAVAARSYAENYIGAYQDYDLVDTTARQVYYGYNPSYTRVKEAVDETANRVVTYNGDVVTTYFASSNGGYTDIPQHRGGPSKLYPYQIIQEDPYDSGNPNSRAEELIIPKAWNQRNEIKYKDFNDSSDSGSGESANAYNYIISLVTAAAKTKGYTYSDSDNNDKIISVDGMTPYNYDETGNQRHDLPDYNGKNICPDMLNADVKITVTATRKATSGEIQAASVSPSDTAQPTEAPSDTAQPTEAPSDTAQPTEAPSDTAQPTEDPSDTTQPTEAPSDTAQPTQAPTDTAQPTQEPQPTNGIIVSALGTVTEPVALDIKLDLTVFSNSDSPYYAFDNHTNNIMSVVKSDSGNWYIYHGRFGHGLGMSQYGAQARANSSDPNVNTYDKIMAFYFPNTQLTTQDYTRPVLTDFTVPDHSNAAVDQRALTTSNKSYLSVMNSDSSSASIIGNLPGGARIHVEEPASGLSWYKIVYGGSYGYVSGSYVDIDNPLPSTDPIMINYETGLGTPLDGVSGHYGDCISKAPVSTRTGYSLEGWYLESDFKTKVSFPYLITDNVTLHAHWVPTQFTITYNLSPGGTTDNPAGYTIESGDIILKAPARPNHTFTGWTIAGTPGVVQNITIPAGSMGNRAYTANWTDTQPQTPFLQSLSCDKGRWTGGFSQTKYSGYKVTLGEGDSNANIKFTRVNDDAAVYVNGTALSYYQSSIPLAVNNGSTKTYSIKVKFGSQYHTYTVKVTKNRSTENRLSSLYAVVNGSKVSFNAQNSPSTPVAFNSDVKTYYLHLGENVSSFKLYDTVIAAGYAKASFTSKAFSVINGQTKRFVITVKPQSGKGATYTVIADRAPSTDSALKLIKTSSSKCKLSPSFSRTGLAYSVNMPSSISSVTLSFSASGYGAKVYVNGARRTSLKVKLAHGASLPVTVVVYPQNTSAAPTTYTIIVSRP